MAVTRPNNPNSVFVQGWNAVKAVWPPMVLIQTACLLVVIGFYIYEPITLWLEAFGKFKSEWGLLFVVSSGFLAGGILPEIAKAILGRIKQFNAAWLKSTLYTGAVYALITFLVDRLFITQTILFGETTSWQILLYKVAFDQLVFSPLISIPLAVGLFGWKDAGFKSSYFRSFFTWRHYKNHVMAPLVMCWFFWGPTVSFFYVLPERLHFVVSACCQGAWSLLFVFMVSDKTITPPE
ncbi:hypothetical protein QPK87_04655 [Kamptonema cortianum]|nr:hypothetical protein [Geitlerinema splendidum]MDK3155866.1 hypothetical protein [Kamptonema cortianum]